MKRLFSFLIFTLTFVLQLHSNLFAQNLLQNGTFNNTTSNWVTSCTSIEAVYFETTYGGSVSTNHVAEVDDESCFHQDICVLPGASYIFSMQASRRTTGSPNPLTTHINISGLDATGTVVGTYVNMDFTRTNTVFSLTAVTGIPVIVVPMGSGVVRLRVTLTDNTTGYSTLGMIVDNLSLVFATPPSISAAGSACQNVATTFSVNGVPAGATDIFYNWSFGGSATPATSTSSTPLVTWSTAGTNISSVTLSNGVCFVDTITYTLPVRATSAVAVYDTICFNAPITFNGVSLNTSGTYLDTFSNIGGCDSVVTLNLFVKPEPSAPSISGDTFYCQGAAFVPFTVTGSGILWYTTATGGVGSVVAPTVPTGTPGVYIYYASQVVSGCEGARDSIRVFVNPTPAAPVGNNVTYCQFEPTVPLTATGTNILWYTAATGGTGSINAPTPSSAVAGVYTWYISQTNNTCEGPRAPVTATINARPPAPVITNSPGAYCPGQPFNTWTIVSGTGILWYTSAVGGVGSTTPPVVNTSIPGTYTFWASQTVLGCEGDRSSVTVTVYSAVTANFTPIIKLGCHGDTVSFINNSVGGVSYMWDFGDGTSSTAVNPIHAYPVQGLYTVKLFTHSYTCVDSNIQTLDLRHKDSAAFNIVSPLLCQGMSTAFTNQSIPAATATYLWDFGDGSTTTVANPSHIYVNTGTYTVALVATDLVPCKDTAYAVVTVDSASTIDMRLSDTMLCRGTYVTMTTDYLHLGDTSLVWNLGNGDSVFTTNPLIYAYPATGIYTITSTVRFRACPTISTTKTVNVVQVPVIGLGPDTSICAGSELLIIKDLLNDGSTGVTWLWNNGATTPSITVSTDGIYYATATLGSCSSSDTVKVTNSCYISIPNVFTPNGDGLNEYFNPRDYLSKGLLTFNMSIYNRWGQLIFETDKVTGRGWDGNFNNEPQPQGVYVYSISATFTDGQKVSQKGNITLLK